LDRDKLHDSFNEIIPNDDAGWTEPKELGCCCLCHENGTTKDCEWCTDCMKNYHHEKPIRNNMIK